ncbi:P27 family phage terminase small subunit [Pannonibacter sp. SL95]|uniref:P27 family phage terminase small subunit n=1 Tax=Pannonibacter sp. SL95 TaxID=2995153 RepID=UPI003FA37966
MTQTRNSRRSRPPRPGSRQLNETFRQFLTLARDFGLTPAAERRLKDAGPSAGRIC